MLSQADTSLVQRETEIPGLETLLDPDIFAELLNQQYSPTIDALSISYVRYKPKTSCLVGYRITTGEHVINMYATAYHSRATDKIQKAKIRPQVPGVFGWNGVIWEKKMIVGMVFPNDAKLKSLPLIRNQNWQRRFLRKKLPKKFELDESTVTQLVYKPERRYVAKIAVNDKDIAAIKVYTPNSYGTSLSNATAFRPGSYFRLPRLYSFKNRQKILVFKWIPGRTLMEIIQDPEVDLRILKKVGKALKELHRQTPDGLRCLTTENEIETFQALGANIGFMCPNLASRTNKLVQKLISRLQEIPSCDQAIHGDFYAKQVIVNRKRITFIDFDGAVRSNPAADLGNFIAHFIRYELRKELLRSRRESLTKAFLKGYLSSDKDSSVIQVLDFYIAVALFKLAPHCFRHREPNWPERIEALLAKVEMYL